MYIKVRLIIFCFEDRREEEEEDEEGERRSLHPKPQKLIASQIISKTKIYDLSIIPLTV